METSAPDTPDALLSSVLQGLQAALDNAPDQATVPVPRSVLQTWRTTLSAVLMAQDDPMATAPVVVYIAFGIIGSLMGLAGCWLMY